MLILGRHVVLAAHCIQEKNEKDTRAANRATLYFGKHNLESLDEEEYQESSAKEFILHPSWNVNTMKYDADLAIIVTRKTIQFTQWVRPICLWTAATSLELVHNRIGTIVGWGKADLQSTQLSTNEPLQVQVPIVSTTNCVFSHESFTYIISNRTFCAGDQLETGPCNGDSGGGFMIYENGVWMLRGVVSVSLLNPQTLTCDVKNHAVFTDVAQFMPWINNIITTKN